MKNYLAFYGEAYYPSPGMDDFIGDYDTLEEAITIIEETHKQNRPDDLTWEFAWGQVWSIETRTVVFSK